LFIELKTESPYKKDGTIKKNAHLEGQQEAVNKLNKKGYYCLFAWSFEQIKNIIDNYLK
jgi:hypothetical protein